MLDPVSLAILGGLQIAAGAGRGISNYMKADVMSDTEKDMLKKLQRDQEMGLLGFSPGEMQDVRQAVVNPMAAMERQQADQLRSMMAGQASPGGAGDAFRVALGQQESMRRTRASAEDKVQQQNLIEKQREEQQLLQLAAKDQAVKAAKKAAIVEAVTGGIIAGGSAATKLASLADATAPGGSSAAVNAGTQSAVDTVNSLGGYFGGISQAMSNTSQMSQMSGPGGTYNQIGGMNIGPGGPAGTSFAPYGAYTGPDGVTYDQYGNPIDPFGFGGM